MPKRTCNFDDCPKRHVEHDHNLNGRKKCGYDECGLDPNLHVHKSDDPRFVRARVPSGGSVGWSDRGDFGMSGLGPTVMAGLQPLVVSDPTPPIGWDYDEKDSNPNKPVALTVPADASDELMEIAHEVLPRIWDLFVAKNTSYQNDSGSAFDLGIKGQYSDMHRKFMKLRKAMWDGQPLGEGEPLDEILRDLVGHCWLTLVMLDRQAKIDVDMHNARLADRYKRRD